MGDPLVYVDTSEIRKGALEELRAAVRELVAVVEANEPRLLAYHVYLSDDGTRMTVMHLHRDSASLEHHMRVAGPMFARFADLLTLSSINVYGRPSEKVVEQLRAKADLLGSGSVVVEEAYAGVSRLPAE